MARVNGQPILLSDYEEKLAESQAELAASGLVTATAGSDSIMREIGRQVLDGMIESALLEQVAGELGVMPTAAEVEAQVAADTLAGGGEIAFSAWLASTGQTKAQYAEEVRSSLILQRVALAVTAQVTPALQEDVSEARALAFQQWLAERRARAVVEQWAVP